ncbi:MAG: hypothetical protein ACRCSL_04745 [Microbacterium sp.]
MAIRQPFGQTRNQNGRDWGNFNTLSALPNASAWTGSSTTNLEQGDTAMWSGAGVQRVFCRNPGTPGSLNAVWGTGEDNLVFSAVSPVGDGTAAVVAGAVYLHVGMVLRTSSRALLGTLAGGTATVRLRRQSTGVLLAGASWSSTGVGLADAALAADVTVADTDWYTIELVGDAPATEALAYGLRLVR